MVARKPSSPRLPLASVSAGKGSIREALLSFLFPPHCPHCHAYVEERGDWCPACLAEIAHFTVYPGFGSVARACSFGAYRGGLRDLIRGLKYQRRESALPYIETVLQFVAEGEQRAMAADFLRPGILAVPVPLARARQKERGFNQAERIFSGWLAEHGIEMQAVLARTRETRPMYGLGRHARRENLRGAFALADGVAPGCIRGRRILLLDDILTTGATLEACAAVLHRAGAGEILGMVLASDHAV